MSLKVNFVKFLRGGREKTGIASFESPRPVKAVSRGVKVLEFQPATVK